MTNTATTTARPASPKQLAFIRSLLERKGATMTDGQVDALSSRSASLVIDDLMARPDAPKPGATVAPTGLHVHDGIVYKVQVSATGNRYAKQLVVRDGKGEFDYVGSRPLRSLSEATVATLEQAQAFGLDFGVCMCCGRTLTNPESIELGIGPVCRKRYF